MQKALPLRNDGASVIINASTAADNGTRGMGTYGASKAAVRSLARTWANELKDRGIRVNVFSPGPIDTLGVADTFGKENAPSIKAALASSVPTARIGRPEEVAAVVAFLASQDSSYLLGANVYVDGGENQI